MTTIAKQELYSMIDAVDSSQYNLLLQILMKFVPSNIELNDGYGSYVCEYGYLHDYSKLQSKLDEATKEVVGPFHSIEDMMKGLDAE